MGKDDRAPGHRREAFMDGIQSRTHFKATYLFYIVVTWNCLCPSNVEQCMDNCAPKQPFRYMIRGTPVEAGIYRMDRSYSCTRSS